MADFDLSASFIPALHKPSALLPITKHRESLLYLIETCPVTIIVGQTGSGKTTQIPQFLEHAGWCSSDKIIGVTQVSCQLPHRFSSIVLTEDSLGESLLLPLPSGSPRSMAVSLAKRSDILSDSKI